MCTVCIANNINQNVYMYLNTQIFPTTGYARVSLFKFIRYGYRMFISVYIVGLIDHCIFNFVHLKMISMTVIVIVKNLIRCSAF